MDSLSNLDQQVLLTLNQSVDPASVAGQFVVFVAVWVIYLLMVLLVVAWFIPALRTKEQRLTLIRTVVNAGIAWLVVTKALGALIHRARPFDGVAGVREFLFHRQDYSFPSDHATFLFALAFGFFIAKNRSLGWIFLVGALLVSFARVVSGFHYPGDIVGGAVVAGLVVGVLHFGRVRELLDSYIGVPLLKLATLLRLAA
jgi:undecaprenyl-diphosphatase